MVYEQFGIDLFVLNVNFLLQATKSKWTTFICACCFILVIKDQNAKCVSMGPTWKGEHIKAHTLIKFFFLKMWTMRNDRTMGSAMQKSYAKFCEKNLAWKTYSPLAKQQERCVTIQIHWRLKCLHSLNIRILAWLHSDHTKWRNLHLMQPWFQSERRCWGKGWLVSPPYINDEKK